MNVAATGSTTPAAVRDGAPTTARRLRSAATHAIPALLVYTAIRFVGILVIFFWGRAADLDFDGLLARSDGGWYIRIAQNGYDMGAQLQSDMAFFPLFPGLITVLEPLTPLGHRGTAILIGWIAALAAAWGLFAIGNHLHGRRVGVMLVVTWAVLPHGIVQAMAYTEALFTALAAWTLFALLHRRWLTAGTLCLFAGLSRPTAWALIAVVGLAALIAVIQRRDGWRPWAALPLAPLGWLGYVGWVGWQMGRPDGWFHVQDAGWGSSFDFGVDTLRRGQRLLSQASALEFYMVTLVLALAIMLFVLSLLDRQPWQLLLFSGLLLFTTLGSANYYHSKARFLLPAFALLIPVATALARTGRAKAYTILTTFVIISSYFGGYLLIIWGRSP